MKKMRFVLVFTAAATAATVMIVWPTDSSPPNVQLAFLGYTNTAAGAEAVFSVRFPRRFGGCGWKGPPQVSRKEGPTWKDWSATNSVQPTMRFFNGPIKRSVGGAEPRAEAFVVYSC